MEPKRVSPKVAKALKEVGYPLTKVEYGKYDGHTPVLYAEPLNEDNWADCDAWYLPTYLEVWLWLWREKKICINCNYDKYNMPPMWWCNNEDRINYNTPNYDDPEEAIIAAIDYLVDNDLIK